MEVSFRGSSNPSSGFNKKIPYKYFKIKCSPPTGSPTGTLLQLHYGYFNVCRVLI